MTTIEARLGTLEVRVDNLETWAGPGQAQALAEGQRELRAELAKVQQTQDRHTRMLADRRCSPSRQRLPADALLMSQEEPLALDPAPVTGEAAVGTHHPVTGHDDPDRVLPVGQAHRT
jgi:hypothetical protein